MGSQTSDSSQLVSVIIPAYNCAAYIGEALSSVAIQGHDRVEVIVVDDGSTDQTMDVVRGFAEQAEFPVACLRQENRGVSAARNKGLDHARGEFVAMLDADDYFLPDKFFCDPRVPLSVRKAERLTRQFTKTWIAWHCFRMGHVEVATPIIVEAFGNSVYEPHETLLLLLSQFVAWSEADGANDAHFRAMYDWFRKVSAVSDSEWNAALRDLNSYLTVWRYYLDGRSELGAVRLQGSGKPAMELPRKLDFFVSTSPKMTDSAAIQKLWNDAVQRGIVNAKDCRGLTQLHLSVLGRALWEKSYITAARSFFAAARAGYRPSAWPAFRDFVRSSYLFLAELRSTESVDAVPGRTTRL